MESNQITDPAPISPDISSDAPQIKEHIGQVLSVDGASVVCWLEIAPGRSVKTRLPAMLLAHLNPHPGFEFVWRAQGGEFHPEQFAARTYEIRTQDEQDEEERLRESYYQNVDFWNKLAKEEH